MRGGAPKAIENWFYYAKATCSAYDPSTKNT